MAAFMTIPLRALDRDHNSAEKSAKALNSLNSQWRRLKCDVLAACKVPVSIT
jgi:hypothetical protein